MYGITWVSSPRHAIATHHEHFFFLIRVSLCGYSLYGMVIRAIFLAILFFFFHLFILIFFFLVGYISMLSCVTASRA